MFNRVLFYYYRDVFVVDFVGCFCCGDDDVFDITFDSVSSLIISTSYSTKVYYVLYLDI